MERTTTNWIAAARGFMQAGHGKRLIARVMDADLQMLYFP